MLLVQQMMCCLRASGVQRTKMVGRKNLLKSDAKSYAVVMGAQIMLRMIECALGIVQRSNYAAKMDVQIKLSMEECALGMVQRSDYAAKMDVQNKFTKTECA
jgi:hypothetical protein